MAEKNMPSLNSILTQFKQAASRVKTASEEEEEEYGAPEECCNPEDAADCLVVEDEESPDLDSGDVAEAAQAVEQAEAAAEQAQDDVVEAKETLQAVADEFINEHNAALKKEAQVFGEIFAASCLQEMNKTASLQEAEQGAYNQTLGMLEESVLQEKLASTGTEAYMNTMAKLAGFDDPQQMAAALGQDQLTPEDLQELAQQAQYAPQDAGGYDDGYDDYDDGYGDEDYSDEELGEMADTLADGDDTGSIAEALQSAAEAADSNAEAIQSIAEAAEALSGEDDGEEQKVASDAYYNTMQALGY